MRLFRPAWDSDDWNRAEKAVGRITNQTKLARVAREARTPTARKAAVEKLTEQSVLLYVAANDTFAWVRAAAVARLTDPDILVGIAKNDEESSVRRAAVKQLTDQSVLAGIAKTDKDSNVRKAAVERLTDQSALALIAKTDKCDYVRMRAADKLDNRDLAQKVYADVARDEAADRDIREEAIRKLTLREVLTEIENGDVAKYLCRWEEECTGDVEVYYCDVCSNPQWDCALSCGRQGQTTTEQRTYLETRTLDLRDVARERLAQII